MSKLIKALEKNRQKVTFSTDNKFVGVDGDIYVFKEFGKGVENEIAFIYEKVEVYKELPNNQFIPIKKLDWSDLDE